MNSRVYARESAIWEIEQDENFYLIAGYTDGGVPYGLTWGNMKRSKSVNLTLKCGEKEVI
jgi:hypothetical protein